ncbi:MAG TPA: hypothetical protein DCY13_15300 [Verrucomicrobiales bacterium]|nr:hypothetical protein [Verrucomicrobiales bacterium]
MNFPLPVVRGLMKRRLLLNYRVRPDVLAALLPAPFQPKLIGGWGIAGICLIRLEQLRPRGLPVAVGLASENVALRIAVKWREGDVNREGVFVPLRLTDSRFNSLAGGRLFPGVHQRAHFWTAQSTNCIKIEVRDPAGNVTIRVAARTHETAPAGSLLAELADAADFFRSGSCGWSPGLRGGSFDGLRLHATDWRLEPLMVEHLTAPWFADEDRFPRDSIEFDSAFLMQNIEHEWQTLPPWHTGERAAA